MNKKIIIPLLVIIVIIGLYISFKPSTKVAPITPSVIDPVIIEPETFSEESKPVVTTPKSETASNEVRFSGTVDSYSTGCYADGECSITISGKKVTTTLGWHQEVVGKVIGVDSLDDVKIGAKADVYAKKTDSGYTLYGNKDYYIKIK